MNLFDMSLLKSAGTEPPDTATLARLFAEETPHLDLKPLARRYVSRALLATLLQEAVDTDGGHHKQWFLERLAEELEVPLPEHDEGVAP